MAVIVSPVGLAAAPVANVANIMVTYKEKLCRPYCIEIGRASCRERV